MARCGLSAIKCQHRAADMAYPPHSEEQEKRATADIKCVLTFDWYRALTAAAQNGGATEENMEPRLVGSPSLPLLEFIFYSSRRTTVQWHVSFADTSLSSIQEYACCSIVFVVEFSR